MELRLLSFKRREATEKDWAKGVHRDVHGWRWSAHIGMWKNGAYISVDQECLLRGREWSQQGMNYFSASITHHFMLGSEHLYYDGPHCSFSLGFLHLNWRYWWCKKCCEESGVPY